MANGDKPTPGVVDWLGVAPALEEQARQERIAELQRRVEEMRNALSGTGAGAWERGLLSPPGSFEALPPNVPRIPPPGTVPTTPAAPIDFSSIFANMGGGDGGGYTPQFVDTRFAESILPLTETPEERAALQAILDDLQARAEAGTTAVRTGWEQVRAVNSAAADKARQMAQEAGPEAARLWIDAANQALTLSSQAAQGLAQFGGMQSVNISPTGGVMNIAALMAAQAPRAQQLAERMGLISAEDIASQARTASMMGEAYAGEIQRTSLIQANNARMAHNERVMSRIASNQQAIAQMRFGASQTNAQIANSAAQFAARQAAAGSANPRQRIREFVEDVETFGTVKGGAALLAQLYGLTPEAAQQIIDGTKSGIIDWARQQGLLEAQIAAARKAAGG
jgi:hypothetical protein